MKAIFLLLFGTAAFAAWAEPMTFMAGGYDGRCELCGGFIQASGEITEDTPRRFEAFVQEVGNPGLIRLNSPGGSLRAGIELGEKLRALRFATEVGSDEADPKGLGYPAFGDRKSNRVPGTCASACAYAFLGGVKRTIEGGSKLGVHRFYRENKLAEPTVKLFTGEDLDHAQRLTAALVLYTSRMGVDGLLVSIAASASPDEMRWITADEAQRLRIVYEPYKWMPWRVEAYRGGAIAISETYDGQRSMVASCSRQFGPQVVLTDKMKDAASFFEQKRTCGEKQPVFGTHVDESRMEVRERKEGGAFIRFKLPTSAPPLFYHPRSPSAARASGARRVDRNATLRP